MKKILIFRAVLASFCLFFFIFLILFFPQKVFAVTTNIKSYPSSITTEPFIIEVSISGAATGTNYLRTDLYKEGTQNYFGETYNGSAWYGGSDHTQYFSIAIQSGATASASFQARFGSPTTSKYDGTGNYKLRIRRYTGSGSYSASEANNSSVSISIVTSTPTPTPTPSPSPTPTPSPSPTPTSTPKPATPKPTTTPTPTPSPKPTTVSVKLSQDFEKTPLPTVLQASSPSASPKSTLTPTPKPKKETKILGVSSSDISKLLIGIGFVIIVSSLILAFRSFRKI